MAMYDVGIVGFWYGKNYGSILTYYSLYKFIEEKGYTCLLINKPLNLWDDSFYEKETLANRFFIREKCNRSRIRRDDGDWRDLNNFCDSFMCGSDVVWKYTLPAKIGFHFFLDFVWNDKKKISYASSFGGDWKGNSTETRLANYYLRKFDYLSCRESEGTHILRDFFGVRASQVLDPVFLPNYSLYYDLASKANFKVPEHYICSYVLGPGKNKRDMLVSLQKLMGDISLINMVNAGNESKCTSLLGLETVNGIDVEDWLRIIKDCSIYIGDSFHGICFSIIFRKKFILIRNRVSPSKCRFDTLLNICGLDNRSIYSDEDIKERPDLLEEIDYDEVYEKIKPYITNSKEFLSKALSSHKTLHISDYDVLLDKYIKLENEFIKLRNIMESE